MMYVNKTIRLQSIKIRACLQRTACMSSSKLILPKQLPSDLASALVSDHGRRNLTQSVLDKVGRNLHKLENHPLGIVKAK